MTSYSTTTEMSLPLILTLKICRGLTHTAALLLRRDGRALAAVDTATAQSATRNAFGWSARAGAAVSAAQVRPLPQDGAQVLGASRHAARRSSHSRAVYRSMRRVRRLPSAGVTVHYNEWWTGVQVQHSELRRVA